MKRFFAHAIEKREGPEKIPLDGYVASLVAVGEHHAAGTLPTTLRVRTNRYLNNVREQDHRGVKQHVRPRLGVKHFDQATTPITGIALIPQIKRSQFAVSALCSPQPRPPQMGEAVLAA